MLMVTIFNTSDASLARVRFNNRKHLPCSNNLSLETENKVLKSCVWGVAVCVSETGDVGKYEERVVNALETWCWIRILKIKCIDSITNNEVFQRSKEERLLLKILKTDATHG